MTTLAGLAALLMLADPSSAAGKRAQPPASRAASNDLACLAEGWEDLHVGVLYRHLRLLASPHTEAAERADILAWLDAPLVFNRPARALSFQACLAVYDARLDPAEFQQLVRRANRYVVNHRCGRAA